MRASCFRRLLNLWPPYLCSSIRVTAIAADWSSAEAVLKLRPWNRNYVGTQFGGSLFAMADPMFMLLAMHRLGRDYYVWDQAGQIDFVAPGRGHVHAHFAMDDAAIAELRAAAADGSKVLRWFESEILAAGTGELVVRVRKQLYVRLKPKAR